MAELREKEQPDTTDAEEKEKEGPDLAEKFAALEKQHAELINQSHRDRQELANAKGQVQVILDQIQRAAAAGDQSAQKAEKTLKDQFDEDPVRAMNDLVTMRVGPVVQEYFAERSQDERAQAVKENPEMFKKYGREIDEFMRDMPLDVKAKRGSYTQALKYVRSLHLDEEVEAARKDERERAAKPESPSPAEAERERKKAISRDEREVMKAFDMDEDDWAKWGTASGERPPKAKRGKAA